MWLPPLTTMLTLGGGFPLDGYITSSLAAKRYGCHLAVNANRWFILVMFSGYYWDRIPGSSLLLCCNGKLGHDGPGGMVLWGRGIVENKTFWVDFMSNLISLNKKGVARPGIFILTLRRLSPLMILLHQAWKRCRHGRH